MNFDEWWNEGYEDKDNPFEKDSFGYWAYAGWCAAMQEEKKVWVGFEYETGNVLLDIKVFDAEQQAKNWAKNIYYKSVWREYKMIEVE